MNFIDAQEMQRKNPVSFEAPTEEELSGIKPRDFIKVCPDTKPGERFWVLVTNVVEDVIVGEINNDLIYSDVHGLKDGDSIECEKRHVYQILEGEPKPVN